MRTNNDATVRRTTFAAAVRSALSVDYPPSRRPPDGSIVIEPGAEPGTLRLSRGYETAPAMKIPAEGAWTAQVAASASMLVAICKSRPLMALRLTFFGGRLMVGATSIPAEDVRQQPGDADEVADDDMPPMAPPRPRKPRKKRWRGPALF